MRDAPRPQRCRSRAGRGVRGGGVRASHEPGVGAASAYARDRRQRRPEPRRHLARARRRPAPPYLPPRRRVALPGAAALRADEPPRRRLEAGRQGDGRDRRRPRRGAASVLDAPRAGCRASRRAGRVRGGGRRRSPPSPPATPSPTPDLDELRRDWAARADEHGFGAAERAAVLGRVEWRLPTPSERSRRAQRLLADDGLCETRAAFSDADLVAAWAAALPQGAPARRVRALASRVRARPRASSASTRRSRRSAFRGATRRASSPTSSATRSPSRSTVARRGAPHVSLDEVAAVIDEHHSQLTAEQRAMVTETVAQRRSGSSASSATPAPARRPACARSTTSSPRTGHHARRGAVRRRRRDARTGDRHPVDHAPPPRQARAIARGLPHRSVVVVDEAAMADTRTLHRLLQHASAGGGEGRPRRRPRPARRRRPGRPARRARRTPRRDAA